MKFKFTKYFFVTYLFLHLIACANQPINLGQKPSQAAIASAHPLATAAGFEILNQGGNAFDAAVAVAAVLGVVEPYSAGIGGGGFWLLHRERDQKQVVVDAREQAPSKATRDMYLDENSNYRRQSSINGPLSAAIPGQAAAFAHIAKKYGNLPLEKTLAPAIRLAKEGFPVNPIYQRLAKWRYDVLQQSPAAKTIFLPKNKLPELGDKIIQTDLANTLKQLSVHGHKGFYEGKVAEKLVNGVREAGGIWQLNDLANYQIKERLPIKFDYKDFTVVTVPPPSAGGVALATMLNILESYPLSSIDRIQKIHLITEAMRRAYWDRARYLGDADFVNVPIKKLMSKQHARALKKSINLEHATKSENLKGPKIATNETHTTHFSVLDKAGNRVAATLSINLSFGSGFVPPETGVLLNNEMDDFAATPGQPNSFGLIGSEANAIEPGKRPLSSMTPTFVENENKLAILGTPGGSRIINMILLAILDFEKGEGPEYWVSRPRFHHQYFPDVLQHEPEAFSSKEKQKLTELGHELKEVNPTPSFGNMQVIFWDKKNNKVSAASDPRGLGAAVVE